jgi:hypothetical protein
VWHRVRPDPGRGNREEACRGRTPPRRTLHLNTPPVSQRIWWRSNGDEREELAEGGGAYKGGRFHRQRKRAWRFHTSRASQPPSPRITPKSPERSRARPCPRKMMGGAFPWSQAEGTEMHPGSRAGRRPMDIKHAHCSSRA